MHFAKRFTSVYLQYNQKETSPRLEQNSYKNKTKQLQVQNKTVTRTKQNSYKFKTKQLQAQNKHKTKEKNYVCFINNYV